MKQLTAILIVSLFVFAGCSRSAITVDNEQISKEVFDLALKERMNSHKGVNAKVNEAAVKKAVVDEMVAQALLVEEAKAKKISVTDEEVKKTIADARGPVSEAQFQEELKKKGVAYKAVVDKVRSNLIVYKLMTSLVKEDSITDSEMESLYKSSPVPFMKPERVFVAILQINTQGYAQTAVSELKKGEEFEKVAKKVTDSSAGFATDYGWIDPDTLPTKELSLALKNAKTNVFSGPYKGSDGSYYLFKVKERQAAEVMRFEDAKPRIKNMLLSRKRQEIAARIVENGKKKARIKINV